MKANWQSYQSEMEALKDRLGQTEKESAQRVAELAAVREQADKGRSDIANVWQIRIRIVIYVCMYIKVCMYACMYVSIAL